MMRSYCVPPGRVRSATGSTDDWSGRLGRLTLASFSTIGLSAGVKSAPMPRVSIGLGDFAHQTSGGPGGPSAPHRTGTLHDLAAGQGISRQLGYLSVIGHLESPLWLISLLSMGTFTSCPST